MRFAAMLTLALALLGALVGLWLQSGSAPPPLPRQAARVVLFAPNLTESAHALGYGERVVGITDYCIWPPEAMTLPRVGGMINPNLERLAALRPDLLVVQGEANVLRQFAREQGIRLAAVKMDDELSSILSGFARLDSLLGGDGNKARALQERVQTELDEVQTSVRALQRPRALISLGHDPHSLENLYTVGARSFLGELLELAGAEHIYADSAQSYFLLSLETLSANRPEVVLEFRPGETIEAAERARLSELWRSIGADLRVEVLDFEALMIPGPRVAETARALRAALHPKFAGTR